MQINYARDNLFDELGIKRLRESYMREDESSPQDRFAFVAKEFGSNEEHAQRLYDYASKHWLSFSTPVLAYGKSAKGLPISCFDENTEVLTKNGFKKISKIEIGDEVLSHDGNFHPVEIIREQDSEDMYKITFKGEDFFVTGNHLILTAEDDWVRVDELDPDRHNILSISGDFSE